MKTVYRWLAPALYLAILPLLVSCAVAPYIPNAGTVQNMSVDDARKALVMLKEGKICYYGFWVDTHIHCDGTFRTIDKVRVAANRLIITDAEGKQSSFKFDKLPEIISDLNSYSVKLSSQPEVHVKSLRLAGVGNDIANALYVLRRSAINLKRESAEYDASFAASLPDYRKQAASSAALPEEANRYRVQAEGAVRDKQFDDAADLYAEALKIVPWWPAGHFNRALVLGETGEYNEAMREMKFYLQLVPDAPNARAAQDKIYDWERLESK